MAVRCHVPGYLRPFTGGQSVVWLEGSPVTVGEALALLWKLHLGVRDRVLTERGEVRPHVNVFVGSEDIRHTGGLSTPIADGSEIWIVPAVSGGTILVGKLQKPRKRIWRVRLPRGPGKQVQRDRTEVTRKKEHH